MLLAGLVGALGACTAYRPEPVDLRAHATAYGARLAEVDARVLTLDEGERVALWFNADLRLARLRAGVEEASAEHAGLWEDPALMFDVMRMIEGGMNPWETMARLRLTIPLSGRLAAERDLAQARVEAERATVRALEWRTRMEVRRAWAEGEAATARAEALARARESLAGVVALVDAREGAGESARLEGDMARLELAALDLEVRREDVMCVEAGLAIKARLGLPPDAPVAFAPRAGEDVAPGRPDLASGAHPEIEAALAEHEAMERDLAREVRAQYPDLELGGGLGKEEGEGRVLLGVGVPLPLWNRNREGIARASAARAMARGEAGVMLERLEAEWAAAQARWEGALAGAALARARLAIAERRWSAARQSARLEEFDAEMLARALDDRLEAEMDAIGSRLATRLALIDLESIAGPPVPEAPGVSRARAEEGER